MKKIDLKKDLKEFYNPLAKEVSFVDVPKMNFLMIDGKGNPNTSKEYIEAIEVLYAVSYTLKFTIKKQQEINYSVMPLEGLWWLPNGKEFSVAIKDDFLWTAMIMQPKYVTSDLVDEAIEIVRQKKNPKALPKLRFENFSEGKSAQIMYFGSYADEAPTIKKIHEFIKSNDYKLFGKHHEIYLSDPRRTAPEELKTIIRQPVI